MIMADEKVYQEQFPYTRVLLGQEEIQARVGEMGAELSRRFRGETPLLITLLKGGFIFLADLCRAMTIPHELDFMLVRSYEGATTTGTVQIIMDLKTNIESRHVVLVEDIVDTGLTLEYIREHLALRKPASLTVCCLLDKKEAREVDVPLEMVGFTVPNEYLVGYGLDYNQLYRNLPFVAAIDPDQA